MGQATSKVAGTSAPITDPRTYDEDTSTGEIRSDIRQTRSAMDSTIDQLGERLHPRHLLDDVLDWFRGSDVDARAAAQNAGSKVVNQLKQHPIPAALIAAGVTWLMFEDGSRSAATGGYDDDANWDSPPGSDSLRMRAGSLVDARTGQPYDESYGAERQGTTGTAATGAAWTGGGSTVSQPAGAQGPGIADRAKGAAGKVGDQISSAAGTVKDALGSAAGAVSGAAGSAASRVAGAGSTMRSGASRGASSFRHGASSTGRNVQHGYAASRDWLWQTAEEVPLAVGAAAMGLGLILGLAVPRTRREDELMGEASDELMGQAKAAGQDLLERGKDIAQSTVSAAADEAGAQGIDKGSLSDKATTVAAKLATAAKEVLKEEHVTPGEVAKKAKRVAGAAQGAAKETAKQHKDELKQ